jgi:AraC-like DNA-binding protein
MISFPLPIFNATLILGAALIAWRVDLGNRTARNLLRALLGVIAIISLTVGLRFGYGVEWLRLLQPVLALLLGPLAYMLFLSFFRPSDRRLFNIGNTHVILNAVLVPNLLRILELEEMFDVLISLNYIFYACLIIMLWRRGPDALTQCRLQQIANMRVWMIVVGAILTILSIVDGGIAFAFWYWGAAIATMGVSWAAVFGLGLTLGLIVFGLRLRGDSDKMAPKVSEVSLSLEPKVNAFLRENHRFADPNLTLDKLAKRIHIPARKISTAINYASGMNVSQYINQMRLEYAAEALLKSDDPVAHIGEKSGFLTRSNFYREFQRVYGTTPAAYRDQERL